MSDAAFLLPIIVIGLLLCIATNTQPPRRGGSVWLTDERPVPYPHDFPLPCGMGATPEERAAERDAVVRYCRDHPEFDYSVHRGYSGETR